MVTRISRLVKRAGGLCRCFSSSSDLIRNGPGLKEFINSGINGTSSFGVHQLDYHEDRVPYLEEIDINGCGRKGMNAIMQT